MRQSKFPYEPWQITESGFAPDQLRENESDFALGNGFIGMRGNLEENTASGAETIQGTFLNGVFDSEPIVYGETAYGYAKNHETICNVCDAKSVYLALDGERLDLGISAVEDHRRVLDMRAGRLDRSFRWRAKSGCVLEVEMSRLVSLTRLQVASVRVRARCVEGSGRLAIRSEIRPAVIAQGDPNDPRNASGKDRRLSVGRMEARGDVIAMQQRTKNTGFAISCAVSHRFEGDSRSFADADALVWEGAIDLKRGGAVAFEKTVCYAAERCAEGGDDERAVWEGAKAQCLDAPGFAALAEAQAAYMDRFWQGAGMSIEGDDALLQGLRFNLFHLLQSAGRDGRRNIAAKGLTGEGYEGHYFWDTEAYIIPVFLHTEPDVARKLLEYRYSILPNARARARTLGHPKGALFAWRTIDGEECSAYFPAGTAQYHINGDIAHAIRSYYYVTQDLDFLARCGGEMLVETARLYYDLGFFSREKGGRFVINCVTGPDEYNVMVDNNVYTNRMAAENFRWAAECMELLSARMPRDYERLCRDLGYSADEGRAWLEAADRMYYPPKAGNICPQDDGFMQRKPWPLDSIPADKHPLLMYYHGLTIYRHMVCKQADLILAMTIFGDQYTMEEKRDNFFFYDGVTTHDSSLSMAIFSILASEIGEIDTAYDYFMASARLDLDDMHHNSKDGLHMANMAGAWNCITKGFGGMRYENDTLSFSPVCPRQWQGYAFRVRFRGRTIAVEVSQSGARYALAEGDPIAIYDRGTRLELVAHP